MPISFFIVEISILIMPTIGTFGEDYTVNITKPDLGRTSCPFISTGEHMQESSLAGKFRDKQRTTMPSAIIANQANTS